MTEITSLTNVSSKVIDGAARNARVSEKDDAFGLAMQNAMNMVKETNDLQNKYESAEIQFALGDAINTHDLQIAQEKANVSLQYTIAVRDKLISAYQELMNMQI